MKQTVNNDFYDELGEKWESATDHPIALLRAENRLRNRWIASQIPSSCAILDMGCGAGFLTHDLAQNGHRVTGIDLSEKSLEVARLRDSTVEYLVADVAAAPFQAESFDVVCAMDILEHVENPQIVIQEASRLLKPGGLFFFHTFNRNLLSWLVIIKGVEWCVKNTPDNMHVLRLFIKPQELRQICANHQLEVEEIRGVNPKFTSRAFWKMVLKREVPGNLDFVFTKSLLTGYSGYARKKNS